ncbi:hypothetical protein [Pseudoneobacillus sp. C159]
MNTLIDGKKGKTDCFPSELQIMIGIWINGQTYWLQNQTERMLTDEMLSIRVKQQNPSSRIRQNDIFVTNHNYVEKALKILVLHRYQYATQDHLSFISPKENVIFHLANSRVYLVNGYCEGQLIQQPTIQPLWVMNTEQIWKCPSEGKLNYLPMVKGIAISLFTFDLYLPSSQTRKAATWSIQGESKCELLKVNQSLLKNILAFPFKK